MNRRQRRRIGKVVRTRSSATRGNEADCIDFAAALHEARRRLAAGDPIPQTPITQEMIADPVYGQFWRRMHEARERVRSAAAKASQRRRASCPPAKPAG